MSQKPVTDFESLAPHKDTNLVAELLEFMRHNKKYWLLPILLVLMLVAGLIMLSSTAAAPFIYALF